MTAFSFLGYGYGVRRLDHRYSPPFRSYELRSLTNLDKYITDWIASYALKWTTWSTQKDSLTFLLLILSVLCSLDQHFLVFFFSRLKGNQSGRYQQDFPFISLCGRERNFLRCEDQPVVFTHLLSEVGLEERLSYCGGGTKLTVQFCPESLFMHPVSGRVYHPGPERGGGVGLVSSALAIELSSHFEYAPGQECTGQPTHFLWGGHRHTLTKELAKLSKKMYVCGEF